MSIVSYFRQLAAERRVRGLDTYAKMVVEPGAFKEKDVLKLEQSLADAGKTVDQLEADIAAYATAKSLQTVAKELPKREAAYMEAVQAGVAFDGQTVGELARRRAMLKFQVESPHGGMASGPAGDEHDAIEIYDRDRKRDREPLMEQRKTTGKAAQEAREADQRLKELIAILEPLGIADF